MMSYVQAAVSCSDSLYCPGCAVVLLSCEKLRAVQLTFGMCLQGQDRALTDAWIGNMLMDPQKGKQEVLTSNNEVPPQTLSNCI